MKGFESWEKMNTRIQVIIAVFIILALAIIINMIRKKALELRYALAWIGVGIGVLILDFFPRLMEVISEVLGIADPVNMLFFLGFCFSLIIIFILTIAISRMSVRIKELAQELALYNAKEIIEDEHKRDGK